MEPNVAAHPADGMGAPPARTAAEVLSGDGIAAALLPPSRVPAAQIVRPPVLKPQLPPVIGPGTGTWVEEDIVVAAALVSNGDESSTLIIPASPLSAGNYTLTLALKRSRWETTTGDPQATYQDTVAIPLAW